MSLLASLLTSYETGQSMRHEVIIGVERRRRGRDREKQAILSEVGVNGSSVADVARAHDITRQHIYQWRQGVDPDMRKLSDMLEDVLYMEDMLDETKREAIRRTFRVERFDTRARVSRQRLALRYLKEARARRDRALAAFLLHCDVVKGDVL